MKFNVKVVIAAVLIVAAAYWAISSLGSTAYSGTNLNFGVGAGTVTVTNPSDEAIPVNLVGSGTRSFAVVSSVNGIAGTSTREGNGSTASQTFAFDLPPGVMDFTVDRGNNVQFVAATDTRLEASSNVMTSDSVRSTWIVAILVILGALYYMSNATGHRWLSMLRGKQQELAPAVAVDDGQGRATRSYGDNLGTK